MFDGSTGTIVVEITVVAGFFLLLFLALIRPQLRRLKRHNEMLTELRPGDRILTNGGLIGNVVDMADEGVARVEFAPNIVMKVKTNLIYERAS